jgi:hypothetical protein
MKRLTYSTASKQAETVTLTELEQLIADCNGVVTVLHKNCTPKHTWDIRIRRAGNYAFAAFEYCNRQGYLTTCTASVRETVFHLYTMGRMVKVGEAS